MSHCFVGRRKRRLHLQKCRCQFHLGEWLSDDGETLAGSRQKMSRKARGHEDGKFWPAAAYLSRELETAHATGHQDVGEHQTDVRLGFKLCYGLGPCACRTGAIA